MNKSDLQFDARELGILTQVVYKENKENDSDFIVAETMKLIKCIARVREKHRKYMEQLNQPFQGNEFKQ